MHPVTKMSGFIIILLIAQGFSIISYIINVIILHVFNNITNVISTNFFMCGDIFIIVNQCLFGTFFSYHKKLFVTSFCIFFYHYVRFFSYQGLLNHLYVFIYFHMFFHLPLFIYLISFRQRWIFVLPYHQYIHLLCYSPRSSLDFLIISVCIFF